MKRGEWSRALQRWGETPSSPDVFPLEIRARRSLAPPGSRETGRVSMKVTR